MKLLATAIFLKTNTLIYDVYDDDGVTLIESGREVDYTAAIAANPGDTTLANLFTLMASDAVAGATAIKAKVAAAKTELESQQTSNTAAISAADAKLASLDTAPSLITA